MSVILGRGWTKLGTAEEAGEALDREEVVAWDVCVCVCVCVCYEGVECGINSSLCVFFREDVRQRRD